MSLSYTDRMVLSSIKFGRMGANRRGRMESVSGGSACIGFLFLISGKVSIRHFATCTHPPCTQRDYECHQPPAAAPSPHAAAYLWQVSCALSPMASALREAFLTRRYSFLLHSARRRRIRGLLLCARGKGPSAMLFFASEGLGGFSPAHAGKREALL